MRLLAALSAVLLLAACDTAAPEPSIALSDPLPEVSVLPTAEPLTVDLRSHFEANEAVGAITFAAFSEDPAVADVELRESQLTVTFKTPGQTAIRVTATASGLRATDALVVHVQLGPLSGQADFVPMTPGAVWDYDYTFSHDCFAPTVTRSGRVTVAFVSVSDEVDGERTYTAELHADYVEERTEDGTTEQTEVDERSTITVTETALGVAFGTTALTDLRFLTPRLLPRYYPETYDFAIIEAGQNQRMTLRKRVAPSLAPSSGPCSPEATFAPR
ncbi:hypothetical protein [Rubrivirga sp. IMCC43871]|uniref:hypothetical protein n=1 Tax=Rubrivirga sp. IMCC43871 TaxID=3391575 RepID=UPI0039903A27